MEAVGYAMLPVIPSFEGISRDIEKKIAGPLARASKGAGEALEKSVGSNIDKVAERAEKAQYRQKKATEELASAQSKLEQETLKNEAAQKRVERAAQDVETAQRKHAQAVDGALDSYSKLSKSGTASAEQLAAAEQKITDARAKGERDISAKEEALLKARASLESQSQRTASAESKLKDAELESATASKRAADAAEELGRAQKKAGDESAKSISTLDKFRASAEKMGSGMVGAAEKFRTHASIVVGAIGGLAGVSMAYASEAEQSYGAVESIFGEHADAIVGKSKEAAEAVGLSGREYRELSSLTGAMLKNMGMPMEQVTDKTQDLIAVAGDLSATFGGSTKDAIEAVNALLRGEADPIEKYGVSIKKTDVNARLAAKGLDKLEGSALKQAEAQELLSMLTEQTASAQGQFGREVDTAAHKQQVATAKLNDAKEVIGTALLPIMADLADMAGKVAAKLGEHPKVFMAVAGAAAALAGGIVVLGTAAPIFTALAAAAGAAEMTMWGYVSAQVAAIAPVAALVAGIAAVVGALALFFTKTEAGQKLLESIKEKIVLVKDAMGDLWGMLTGSDMAGGWHGLANLIGVDNAQRVFDFISGVQTAWEEMVRAFKGEDWGYGALAEFIGAERAEWVVNAVAAVGDKFRDVIDIVKQVPDLVKGVWDILFKRDYTGLPFGLDEDSKFVDVLFTLRDTVQDVAGVIVDKLGQAWGFLSGVLLETASALGQAIGPVLESVKDTFVALFDAAVTLGKAIGGALLNVLKGFWELLKGLWPVLKLIGMVIGGVIVGAVWAAAKAFQFLAPLLGTVVAGALQLVAKTVEVLAGAFSWLVDNVVAPMISKFGEFVGFIAANLVPAITSVAGFIGGVLVGAWNALSTAVQWAWDSVIKPVFDAISTAAQVLLAVVGTAVLGPLLVAWNLLSWGIKAAWENIIKPAWDALGAAATWLWQNILVPAFDGIKLAFQAVGDGVKWVWENVIKVAWDALAAAATWLWQTVLMPVFDAVKAGFQAVGDAISWVWNNVIKPTWDALTAAANWLWQNVLLPVFDAIRAGFQALGDGIKWVWENVIKPAWDAMGNALRWLWDNVVNPVIGWMQARWDDMGRAFNVVKDFIVDTVFGGIGRGLDTVKGWFSRGVEGIRQVWDGLRAAAAKPVRFVIDNVWNKGILAAWNKIAEFLPGVKPKDAVELGELGAYAQGGVTPGFTPGRDVHRFVSPTGGIIDLSGGEAIMRPEWTRAVGGPAAVAKMNADAKAGRFGKVSDKQLRENQRILKAHQAFANGGVVEAMTSIILKKYPMMQMTSGYRPTNDNHGRGLAGDFSNGFANTPEMLGLANDIADTYPGAMELIHENPAFDRQIKNGQFVGGGGGSWGFYAGAGDHANHVHWAMNQPPNIDFGGGVFKGGSDGSGHGGMVSGLVKKFWDELTSPLQGALDSAKASWGDTEFAKIPGEAMKSLMDAAWSFITSKIPHGGGSGGSGPAADWQPGAGAEQWRGMIIEAFKNQGQDPRPDLVDALVRQIDTESNGDPNIAQQIVDVNGTGESAGVGLSQVIPGTWEAYRDPSLPDNRRDPWAHTNFMVRYFRDRHNYDTGFVGQGHGWKTGGVLPLNLPAALRLYDRGGVLPHGGMGLNLSGKPEYVFTNDMMKNFVLATGNISDAAVAMQDAAQRMMDPTLVEGITARAGFSQFGELAGLLGAEGVASTVSTLVGAEKQLIDARQGHAERLADITAKEKALEEARKAAAAAAVDGGMSDENKKKLEDAEKAVADARAANDAAKLADAEKKLADTRKEVDEATAKDADKRAEAVTKANEQVTKAENDLAEARKKSAAALDMRIYDVAPQIYGALSQAANATSAIPAVSGALSGLAAAAGPAGMSLGVAIQGIKTFISTVKSILTTIGDFVAKIFTAQANAHKLMVDALNTQYQWAKTIDDMRAKVVELRVAWSEAQVALRDATWKTRLAQADVVRAQLQGIKSVAEAEAKLEAERKRLAKAAQLNLKDLSLAYDRYRWLEHEGIVDRLDLLTQVTPEILALEAEVNAAKLNALANQREASLKALQASWEQQKAALNLMQVQQNLGMMTQQLALMTSELGMAQGEALQAMNTQKLYQEKATIQANQGKNFWRLSYWLTGAGSAYKKRIAELDKQIAEREGSGKGANGSPVKGLDWMSFFGYGDSAANAVKNSGYGDAERKQWEYQEQQQLQQIEQQKKQLEQQIEQNKLYVKFQEQVAALTAEIEALRSAESSAKYTAEYYREENEAIKAANKLLADFEANRAREYMGVARGEKTVVEISIPQQDTYTREQVDAMLDALKQVPSIDARVTKLEAPGKPGAASVLTGATR